jgi:LCP family protein required for cell wall assembly
VTRGAPRVISVSGRAHGGELRCRGDEHWGRGARVAGGERRPGASAGSGKGRGVRRWVLRGGCLVLALLSVLVLGVSGYAWSQYRNLSAALLRSGVLGDGPRSAGGDTNVLIIGLDSRLDELGQPLPPDIYDAMHAGDEQAGGYNANVLMLVHIPGNGGRATSISIPRDDYVSFPGTPSGMSKGKIKQAYGFAFDERRRQLMAQGLTDPISVEQQSRDAGRAQQIATVRELLGGVPIDHFVEVTMVAFYQLARVVEPITVCLNADTKDSYSGADFHRGPQQINAEQALAFVRQRRDQQRPAFTDLDRERRQQAFIASLTYQLKQTGTFTNPARLGALMEVARQNIAVDNDLDLRAFADQAAGLTEGQITFTTLPIVGFEKDSLGQDVNIVDVPKIQAQVRDLIGTKDRPEGAAPEGPAPDAAAPEAATPEAAGPEPAANPVHRPAEATEPMAGGAVPCVN